MTYLSARLNFQSFLFLSVLSFPRRQTFQAQAQPQSYSKSSAAGSIPNAAAAITNPSPLPTSLLIPLARLITEEMSRFCVYPPDDSSDALPIPMGKVSVRGRLPILFGGGGVEF